MRYLTLEQTLAKFRKELPSHELPFDEPQLADLCREIWLQPLFYYDGFALPVEHKSEMEARPFHGYLTDPKLIPLIEGDISNINIFYSKVYEWTNENLVSNYRGIWVHLLTKDFNEILYKKDEDYSILNNKELREITKKQIRFDKIEVEKYITSNNFYDLTNNEHYIEQLETEIADLKAQLERLADTPANTIGDNEIFNYPEIQAIQEIKHQFWENYNPKTDKKGTQQLIIEDWIMKNYPSINRSMAKFLDKIVRQKYIK